MRTSGWKLHTVIFSANLSLFCMTVIATSPLLDCLQWLCNVQTALGTPVAKDRAKTVSCSPGFQAQFILQRLFFTLPNKD